MCVRCRSRPSLVWLYEDVLGMLIFLFLTGFHLNSRALCPRPWIIHTSFISLISLSVAPYFVSYVPDPHMSQAISCIECPSLPTLLLTSLPAPVFSHLPFFASHTLLTLPFVPPFLCPSQGVPIFFFLKWLLPTPLAWRILLPFSSKVKYHFLRNRRPFPLLHQHKLLSLLWCFLMILSF